MVAQVDWMNWTGSAGKNRGQTPTNAVGKGTYPSTAGQALEAKLLGDLGGAHGVLHSEAIANQYPEESELVGRADGRSVPADLAC